MKISAISTTLDGRLSMEAVASPARAFRAATVLFALILMLAAPMRPQEPAQPPSQPAAAEPDNAVPDAERRLTGRIDIRNRFVQDIGGNFDVYRSVVNLGEGPRLVNGTLRYADEKGRIADEINLSMNAWGGDPYNTSHLDAKLRDVYRFRLDYSNIAYFNSLPSYANPLLGNGVLLSQRAMDLNRRLIDTEIVLLPSARISPFFAYSGSSGYGRGVTAFVMDSNEYPVRTDYDDHQNTYRGGVEVHLGKADLTFEQGRTTFFDRQAIFEPVAGNNGNRRTPLFGRTLTLNQLDQQYDVDGSGQFSRVSAEVRPFSWLTGIGQFYYSQPEINVRQQVEATGNLYSLAAFLPVTTFSENATGSAKRPFPSGSWSTEIRPFKRLRVVQSYSTERFHIAGASAVAQMLESTTSVDLDQLASSRLVLNYNRHQIDVIWDVNGKLILRGGHRYVWADATVPAPTLILSAEPRNFGETKYHAALAGANWQVTGKLNATFDFEASPGDRVFFRTGLMDYRKGKARLRYRWSPSFTVTGAYSILDNQNPAPDIQFDFRSQQSTASIFWAPNQGKRFTIAADYTRSTVRSRIPILSLPFFTEQLAFYRDAAHLAGAYGELVLPKDVRLQAGGSLSVNAGSRPTRYYQPRIGLSAPLHKRVSVVADWNWYGFREPLFLFENFRTNVVTAGLQFGF